VATHAQLGNESSATSPASSQGFLMPARKGKKPPNFKDLKQSR